MTSLSRAQARRQALIIARRTAPRGYRQRMQARLEDAPKDLLRKELRKR